MLADRDQYRTGLRYAVHYTRASTIYLRRTSFADQPADVCAAFAATFLIRIARLFPHELNLKKTARDVEELASVLSESQLDAPAIQDCYRADTSSSCRQIRPLPATHPASSAPRQGHPCGIYRLIADSQRDASAIGPGTYSFGRSEPEHACVLALPTDQLLILSDADTVRRWWHGRSARANGPSGALAQLQFPAAGVANHQRFAKQRT